MKLVETDAALAADEAVPTEAPIPPRPEHRKAYVSLFVTTAVLVATVAVVYLLFPKRNHEVIGDTIEVHRAAGEVELARPSPAEMAAWSLGVLGRPVPWPSGEGLEVVGLRRLALLKRPAAMARYAVDGVTVTVVAMVPWDAPARTIRRTDGDATAVWWRRGQLTFIAVGPSASAEAWRRRVGAP